MTRFRTFLAALVIGQFAWCGSAVAQTTPACSTTATDADHCQYHFINSPAVGSTAAVNESGTAFATGLSTAPAPTFSAGVRQDAGIQYILYNNYANGCRFISNNNNSTANDTGDLFVPQATLPEFSKFVANAPNISVSYCAQSITYTPKSAYAPATSGITTPFVLFSTTTGGAGTPVAGTPPLTSPQITVPTTSETNTYTPPVIGSQSGNQYNFTYSYTRSDCILQAGAAYLCEPPIPIVENQLVTFTTVANKSPDCTLNDVRTIGGGNEDGLNPSHTLDCDGTWPTVPNSSPVTYLPNIYYSCSVNGGAFSTPALNDPSACASNFSPPGAPQTVSDYPGALVLILDESGSVSLTNFEAAQTFFETLTSPATGLNFTNTATVATILFNATSPGTKATKVTDGEGNTVNTTPNFTYAPSSGYGVAYLSPVYNPVTNNAGLQTMIAGLNDDGGSTDVYTAVQTALNLITSSAMPSTPKTIVLASDGQQTVTGMYPSSIGNNASDTVAAFTALGKTVAASGVRLIAVGINDGSFCYSQVNCPKTCTSNSTGANACENTCQTGKSTSLSTCLTSQSTCISVPPSSSTSTYTPDPSADTSDCNATDGSYPPGILVENALTAAEPGGTAGNTFLSSGYATLLADVGAGLEQTITLDAGTVCVPSTLANGTIAAAPSCLITCNSGYTLSSSDMSCVAN